jgi:hypothetical protein
MPKTASVPTTSISSSADGSAQSALSGGLKAVSLARVTTVSLRLMMQFLSWLRLWEALIIGEGETSWPNG